MLPCVSTSDGKTREVNIVQGDWMRGEGGGGWTGLPKWNPTTDNLPVRCLLIFVWLNVADGQQHIAFRPDGDGVGWKPTLVPVGR